MSGTANSSTPLVVWVFLLAVGSTAFAGRIIYVDDDGPADFDNIQAAIDDANNGDVVIVTDGTYMGEGNRDIDFKGKAITVKSENGPENCVIDCQGSKGDPHRGFYFHNREGMDSILEGLTITNGLTHSGGAIRCGRSSPTIRQCVVEGNSTLVGGNGGGIYCSESDAVIVNCSVRGNTAQPGIAPAVAHEPPGGLGSGIYCHVSRPVIVDCTVTDNTGGYHGGAIYCDAGRPTIIRCTISRNHGRGIFCAGSDARITDCTVEANGVAYSGGGIRCSGGSAKIRDCTIAGNSAMQGGGVLCASASHIIIGCTVSGNSADTHGGGIWASNGTRISKCVVRDNVTNWTRTWGGGIWGGASIDDCVIVGNSACRWGSGSGMGGGVYCGPDTVITNSVLAGNTAEYGGGVCGCGHDCSAVVKNCTICANRSSYTAGGLHFKLGRLRVENCICRMNIRTQVSFPETSVESIAYCNVEDAWPGEGNIDADPHFVQPGYWDPNGTPEDRRDDFWVDGDYHLKSQAGRWDPESQSWVKDDVTSPCINAGDMSSPIGHEPFPNGGRINMGAYGGTAEASKCYFGEPICETIVAGDINGDCKIDFADFELMAVHWLEDN